MNEHFVILDGKKFTRNSKTREYTHAVVILFRLDCSFGEKIPESAHRIRIEWASDISLARKNCHQWQGKSYVAHACVVENGGVYSAFFPSQADAVLL